jgi:predicted DNA-binding protein (MmcQ/YjbR family)
MISDETGRRAIETGRDAMGPLRTALMARLAEKPGATAGPAPAPQGRAPPAMLYKVMGKMFAIVGLGPVEHVILKCDPHLVEVLKATYTGVGHRSHLDPRFWISVELDADVSAETIDRLVDQSYDLVCATLTRKQRAELGRLA